MIVITQIASLIVLIVCLGSFSYEVESYGWRLVRLFLLSGSISHLLTPLVGAFARRFNVMDFPARRKVHDTPTPLLGGLAIFLGVACAVVADPGTLVSTWPLMLAATVLVITGVGDDVTGLPSKLRLSVQLLATLIIIYSGVNLELLPPNWPGYVGNVLLTVLWVVGITNALNFFDGMDGLATGVSIIMGAFLSIVAFQSGQNELGLLGIVLLGACLGFLPHNFKVRKPAAIFLGDAGSAFLGFMLAAFAVRVQWSSLNAAHIWPPMNPIVSFTAPLLIFGVLIYDMIHITVARFATGKVKTFREWLDYVGKDHLHHRLESLLRSKRGSVLLIYLLSVCLGITAVVLRKAGTAEAIVLVLQGVFVVIIVTILEHEGNRRNRRKDY